MFSSPLPLEHPRRASCVSMPGAFHGTLNGSGWEFRQQASGNQHPVAVATGGGTDLRSVFAYVGILHILLTLPQKSRAGSFRGRTLSEYRRNVVVGVH